MTNPPTPVASPEPQPSRGPAPGQIEAILGVLVQPRRTLRLLPGDRVYVLAFLGPMYFAFIRMLYRTGWEYSPIALLLAGFAALLVVPAFAWFVRQFLKGFGKHLSTAKLMNIGGYALVPRLLMAVAATVLSVALPDGGSRALTLGVAVVAVVVILYSLGLYVYGIVVSPSESEQEVEAP
jgi:hypothetical protein